MNFFLLPENSDELRAAFNNMLLDAAELYVATAYLTDQIFYEKLNIKCKNFKFMFGVDFGITRKFAITSLQSWIPDKFKFQFKAADHISGFHPKIAFYKTHGGLNHVIIGSSNQTSAAFSSNYEANIALEISNEQFKNLTVWYDDIFSDSSQITDEWIDNYTEQKIVKRKNTKSKFDSFRLKTNNKKFKKELLGRRAQVQRFRQIEKKLFDLSKQMAEGKIKSPDYYSKMDKLWRFDGGNGNMFQSPAYRITAKRSDWKEICKSFIKIKTSNLTGDMLDKLVMSELNRLEQLKHPARKAWFSELLCHYFPMQYPLQNNPINTWLTENNYARSTKFSAGEAYINLARVMRQFLTHERVKHLGIKNLTELDLAILTRVNMTK